MSTLYLTETEEGLTVGREVSQPGDVIVHGPVPVADLAAIFGVVRPELVVVCGWRRLLPSWFLALPRRGVVGFHSAKLPEYPGRAPVPWTIVRGDDLAWTTLLYLDAGVDSGDIVDAASVPVGPADTVEDVYKKLAVADIELLRRHLGGLLDGSVTRHPQDPRRRGPLTTREGWDRYHELGR